MVSAGAPPGPWDGFKPTYDPELSDDEGWGAARGWEEVEAAEEAGGEEETVVASWGRAPHGYTPARPWSALQTLTAMPEPLLWATRGGGFVCGACG